MKPQPGKEKILRVALQLFVEKGFHSTSVNTIAKTAQVSKGLIYNYFTSKEELLLTLIDQANEEMFTVANTMASTSDAQTALRTFLAQYAHFLRSNQNHLSFQFSLFFQPDLKRIVQGRLQRRAQHLLSILEAIFRDAAVENQTLLARRLLSELDGIALHHLAVFPDFPLDEMLEQVFQNYKDIVP